MKVAVDVWRVVRIYQIARMVTIYLITYAFPLILLLLIGCISDNYSYVTTSSLENKSSRSVILKFYENGAENILRRVEAAPNTRIELLVDSNDGKGPGFRAFTFFSDSLIMEFDTGVTLTHYAAHTSGTNPDALAFTNSRNFFNEASWIVEKGNGRKKRVIADYTYRITQADFESAK